MLTFVAPPVVVRSSPHGWFGIAGTDAAITAVTIGHPTKAAARQRLLELSPEADGVDESALVRDVADEIARYFAGDPVDLNSLPVADRVQTPFERRVVRELRRVGYGQTVSYAELAKRAGAAGAARAVGSVMSHNAIPLLIPCHRVIGAGGKLGGFSAPRGVELKRDLLELEAGRGRLA